MNTRLTSPEGEGAQLESPRCAPTSNGAIWQANDLSGKICEFRLVAGEAYWAARAAMKDRGREGKAGDR